MSRANVIKVNVVSALATTVAAVIFFQAGATVHGSLDMILGAVAGFFIYIAVSDIIPSIHKNEERVLAGPQTIMLLVGVIVVSLVTTQLHKYIDSGHEHEAGETHEVHSD